MPYTNVPEDLWAKMDKCVKDVQDNQGVSKESAVAICYDSVVGGKSLLDAMVAHADRIQDDLIALGSKMTLALKLPGFDSDGLKVGARHSKEDVAAIQAIHDGAKMLGATCSADEPGEGTPDEEAQDTSEKNAKDLLITFGDAIKSAGEIVDGHLAPIGGYLVRWGSDKEKDIEGQYFTKNTYLGAHDGNGVDTFINHGVPFMKGADEIFDTHLQPVETKRDQIGLFAKTVLDLHNQFEKVLYELSQRGALKWSSGTAPNLVRAKRDGRITQWPIVDASLTPVPAEWRPTNRVLPLKSYITQSSQWSAESWMADFAKVTTDKVAREIPDDLKREAELLKVRVGATAAP